jgi:hypothetical protein
MRKTAKSGQKRDPLDGQIRLGRQLLGRPDPHPLNLRTHRPLHDRLEPNIIHGP